MGTIFYQLTIPSVTTSKLLTRQARERQKACEKRAKETGDSQRTQAKEVR